jgi:hypothetical protein
MRGLVCERISKNRFRMTAFHYSVDPPADIYRRCELLEVARRWQSNGLDRQTAIETMFSRGTLKSFGEKIEIMVLERAEKWDSRTDA